MAIYVASDFFYSIVIAFILIFLTSSCIKKKKNSKLFNKIFLLSMVNCNANLSYHYHL